jgi:hypothetical protein
MFDRFQTKNWDFYGRALSTSQFFIYTRREAAASACFAVSSSLSF